MKFGFKSPKSTRTNYLRQYIYDFLLCFRLEESNFYIVIGVVATLAIIVITPLVLAFLNRRGDHSPGIVA